MIERIETRDTRIVYGFFCSWWGGIEEAGQHFSKHPGLPGCPHCGHGLMQVDSPEIWWKGVDDMETKVPGYRDFISWLKGKCFRDHSGEQKHLSEALKTYNAKPGRVKVVL
jgi:hypothetical protein